jgi:hypothetical protein
LVAFRRTSCAKPYLGQTRASCKTDPAAIFRSTVSATILAALAACG